MKKILAIVLALSLCLSLSAAALAGGPYTPGTYSASEAGHEPGVTVTVTVDENSITDVAVDASHETVAIGGAAADELAAQILAAQGSEIDGVTGATETSAAVRRAAAAALAEAAGSEAGEKTPVADGTYSGRAPAFGLVSQMVCDVTFENGAITAIEVVEESDSQTGEWFANAKELLIPRLLESQSLEVDAITGATASSNGIKNCVGKAIEAAGGVADEWYTPVEKSDATVVIDGYDVIVVGLGGSGVLSYCSAADQGASVFGLEAAGKIGGNSVCTYGPMALNSEYLKATFTDGEDYINADDVYNTWIEYVESEDKADIIQKAVYNSGSALDYYVENFGFEFTGLGLLGSFVVPEWTKEWCVYTPDPETGWNILGPNKTYQFLRALDIAMAKNEKNTYMTELRGESLIFDDAGKVIGVQAKYYDGTTYEIYGDTVILATGGFLGSNEMMIETYGATVNALGDTVNDGTGIRMGLSAGGATYMLHTLPMVHISQVANLIRTDDLTADQKAILTALCLTTDMPMVTTGGEAWGNSNQSGTVDEDVSVEIVFAPDFMYYNIFTQADIDKIRTEGLSEAQAKATSRFMDQGGTLPEAGTPVEDIDVILSVGEAYKDVIKAGSIAELAEKIGCSADVLSETLGGVETTYYAIPCTSWSYGTVGGLDVDVNMNVLREDGTPIENLFAVGQDSEGVGNIDGKAYTPWGGQAQSWTFVSGQIAGASAAAVAKADEAPAVELLDVMVPSTFREGAEIPAYITLPADFAGEETGLVVMIHGHGGNHNEWGGYDAISNGIAENGKIVVTLDFPGCGASAEPFQLNTMTNMKNDVLDVINYMKANYDINAVGGFGYSMGGRIILEMIVEDMVKFDSIEFVAPAEDYENLKLLFGGPEAWDEMSKKAHDEDYVEYTTIYGQLQQLSKEWFDDLARYPDGLGEAAAEKYDGPAIVIYATNDEAVAPEVSQGVADAFGCPVFNTYTAGHSYSFYNDDPDVVHTVNDNSIAFFTDAEAVLAAAA